MRTWLAFAVLLVVMTGMAAAEEHGAGEAAAAAASGGSHMFFTAVAVACVLALAIAAAGCGLAQGNAVARAVESIARQPEAASRILTVSMIGLAFIESLTIYVLVVSLILIYADPFIRYIAG